MEKKIKNISNIVGDAQVIISLKKLEALVEAITILKDKLSNYESNKVQ